MFEDKPLRLVETPTALAAAISRLSRAPVIGVDTESDGFHRYQEKVALIQVSDLEADYIIDTTVLSDLSPLGGLLANPSQAKVLHGADYDVVSLRRDFGFQINNLFDTMVAAQFIGLPRIGLADLIKQFFNIHIDKTLQRHDWSARPLQPEHLDYARGDTHFLPALRELLIWKLSRLGRLHMVQEECEVLSQRHWQGRARNEDDFMRIKGVKALNDQQLRALRALFAYREEQSAVVDRPPFKVIPDEVLMQVATMLPVTAPDVAALFRKNSALARKHAEGLAFAVLKSDEDRRPFPSRVPREAAPVANTNSREAELLLAAFRTWRIRKVEQKGIPMAAVASNNLLKALTRLAPRSHAELTAVPELRQWQLESYGEELLTLIDGVLGKRVGESSKKKRRRRKKPEYAPSAQAGAALGAEEQR